MTLALFDDPKPPTVPGIDLRCCDVSEVLTEAHGARLVHADPPWAYQNAGCRGNAADEYATTTDNEWIASVVGQSFKGASDHAYLLVWCTWPKLAEWMGVHGSMSWRYVSGGSWHKTGGLGVGFHLRGDSEPWLLYVKGTPKPIGFLRNAWTAPRTNHSEKPMGPLCDAVSALCPRAGLVLDLFAGLAPMARACHATGRRYIGAEIDPDRHHQAMCRLALARE